MILEKGSPLVRLGSRVSHLTILPCAALTVYARVRILLRRRPGGHTHCDQAAIVLPTMGDEGSPMDNAPPQPPMTMRDRGVRFSHDETTALERSRRPRLQASAAQASAPPSRREAAGMPFALHGRD